MAIKHPATVNPTETVNVSNTFGSMLVGTANVPAQGKYITLVLRGGLPFDMALSDTIEEAMTAHDQFCLAAATFDLVEALAEGREVDAPPKGNLLN